MPRWDNEEEFFSPLMRLRRSRGMTREQAAVSLGCSLSAMIRYERGRTPVPFVVQKRMIKLYQVSAQQMYEVLSATYAGLGKVYEDVAPDIETVEVQV